MPLTKSSVIYCEPRSLASNVFQDCARPKAQDLKSVPIHIDGSSAPNTPTSTNEDLDEVMICLQYEFRNS